ncbi:hypothetical protein ACVJBD_007462 [Rhizobium mongolense]
MDIIGFVLAGIAAACVIFGPSVMSLPASASPPFRPGSLRRSYASSMRAGARHLRLFRGGAFRAASVGGTVFLISGGAVPFLMPLMLQVGFGLNPFQSGLITIGVVGAISTKFLARRVLAFAGFRTTLIVAAIIAAVTTFVNGFFTPATPNLVMITILLIAGFARSFFFSGVDALSFAEI